MVGGRTVRVKSCAEEKIGERRVLFKQLSGVFVCVILERVRKQVRLTISD